MEFINATPEFDLIKVSLTLIGEDTEYTREGYLILVSDSVFDQPIYSMVDNEIVNGSLSLHQLNLTEKEVEYIQSGNILIVYTYDWETRYKYTTEYHDGYHKLEVRAI